MAVYVDLQIAWPISKKWPYGAVSHLYCPVEKELHLFAKSIGLKRKWCSDFTQPGSALLHYDLSPNKRNQALRKGAIYDRRGRMCHTCILMRKRKIGYILKRLGIAWKDLKEDDLLPISSIGSKFATCLDL